MTDERKDSYKLHEGDDYAITIVSVKETEISHRYYTQPEESEEASLTNARIDSWWKILAHRISLQKLLLRGTWVVVVGLLAICVLVGLLLSVLLTLKGTPWGIPIFLALLGAMTGLTKLLLCEKDRQSEEDDTRKEGQDPDGGHSGQLRPTQRARPPP